jgi:hypothetical protein
MLEKKTEMNKKYWAERNKIGREKLKIQGIMIFVGAVVKIKSRPSGNVCGDIFVVCVLD